MYPKTIKSTKTAKSIEKLQNLHKNPQNPWIWAKNRLTEVFVWFLSLKLENFQLVLSPEKESKGETSIFPWKSAKTTKSMDFGQKSADFRWI